jgi:hypothetical protein
VRAGEGESELEAEPERLRVENARLLRLLELSPVQARPPAPTQTGIFHARPGYRSIVGAGQGAFLPVAVRSA